MAHAASVEGGPCSEASEPDREEEQTGARGKRRISNYKFFKGRDLEFPEHCDFGNSFGKVCVFIITI